MAPCLILSISTVKFGLGVVTIWSSSSDRSPAARRSIVSEWAAGPRVLRDS